MTQTRSVVSEDDLVLEADVGATGQPGDLVLKTRGVERARISNNGGVSGSLAGVEARTPPYAVYLDQLLGSDSNAGNAPGAAVLTLAKAISLLQQAGHGGVVRIVTGLGAGNIDLAAPVSFVYPVTIESMSLTANTIRRTFATPNGRSVWDAVTTVSGASVSSATVAFVAADANRIVSIYGAGTGGGTYYDFIASIASGTVANLTATTAIARSASTDPKGVKLSVVGDWNRVVTDAAMTSGGSVVTSVTAAWTAADIGTEIVVGGAGQGSQALRGAILSVSGNTATITAAASATVSGKRCAIGVNFGDLFTYHVGQCGLSRVVLTDQTSGNASIGAAIKVVSEDLGAGVISSPSDLLFEDGTVTSSDAAGAWEHILDIDGSWNQNSSGTGARRGCFRNFNFFGSRRVTETVRIVNGVHWSFEGKAVVAAAPTAIAQGYMLLDPQKNGGSALVATQDINFKDCEGTGAYFYSEGSRCNYNGGTLAPSVAVSGRNVIELATSADHCKIDTVNAATTNALELDAGTNNVVHTTTVKDARDHAAFGGTVASWRETYDRRGPFTSLTPASGTLTGAPVAVVAGESYGHVLIVSSSTPATFGSNNDGHWYVAVYDDALNLVGQTADQGIAAIAASSSFTLAFQSTLKATKDAIWYAEMMIYTGTGGAPVQPTFKASSFTIAGIPVTGMPRAANVANASLTTGVAPSALVITGSPASLPYLMLYT